MKRLINKLGLGLDVNKDNKLTAAAKGGLVGTIGFTTVALPVFGVLLAIGKLINRDDEVEAFEAEMQDEEV